MTEPDAQAAAARLFPVVHPDRPDDEAEYQRLMRDELVTSRLAGIDTVEAVLARSGRKVPLDEAEMLAFVQAVNSVRLVLGTVLDVGEDDESSAGRRRRRDDRPSTTSTATCRGCSTPPSGRCRATCRRERPEPTPWKRGAVLLLSRCSQLDEASAPIV